MTTDSYPETMSDDWFEQVQRHIESAHWGLIHAKSNASLDDPDYQKELKYVLRGFRHADALFKTAPPDAQEVHLNYLERVVPMISAVPDGLDAVDREPWLDGVRHFVRTLSIGTGFRYPPHLDVQLKPYKRTIREKITGSLTWLRLRQALSEIRYYIRRML